jgi:hypothetical protein
MMALTVAAVSSAGIAQNTQNTAAQARSTTDVNDPSNVLAGDTAQQPEHFQLTTEATEDVGSVTGGSHERSVNAFHRGSVADVLADAEVGEQRPVLEDEPDPASFGGDEGAGAGHGAAGEGHGPGVGPFEGATVRIDGSGKVCVFSGAGACRMVWCRSESGTSA